MLKSSSFLLIYLSNWINSSLLSIGNESVSLGTTSASHIQPVPVVHFERAFLGSLSSEGCFHKREVPRQRGDDLMEFDRMKADTRTTRNRKRNFGARLNANERRTLVKRHLGDPKFNDLSLGRPSLEAIRHSKSIYVDKTRYIVQMLKQEGCFQLLIRPRRFGKTLFLNTIWDVLLGHQHLFKNTYIEQNHDWSTKYTVVELVFVPDQSLDSIRVEFMLIAEQYEIEFSPDDEPIKKTDPLYFSRVVARMCVLKKICNIALLVDEYDLPLLTPGSDSMEYYKQFLLSLKGLLQNGYLKYVIMTGCTSINNLQMDNANKTSQNSLMREIGVIDISTQNEYNAVCGYTTSEIRNYYGHHLDEIQRRHQRTEEEVYNEIQRWYDGYMFSGTTTESAVYNPMSIMEYLRLKEFKGQNFGFVKNDHLRLAVKRLLEVAVAEGRDLLDLEKKFTIDQLYEDTPSFKQIEDGSYLQKGLLESFLFQAGYLTITSRNPSTEKYTLGIPNTEVQRGFHGIIVEAMMSSKECVNYGEQITKNFNDLKFRKLVEVYNNFVRKKYRMRVWTSGEDEETTFQLMFGAGLMLSNELEVIYERETIKRDNGKVGCIDIYLESDQKYKAIIDCKYDDTDMKACMEQLENYNLPSTMTITTLPIVRMCVNFVEGKIERIVARKYDAKDKLIQEIPEYTLSGKMKIHFLTNVIFQGAWHLSKVQQA